MGIPPIRLHSNVSREKATAPPPAFPRSFVVSNPIKKCLAVKQTQSIHSILIELRGSNYPKFHLNIPIEHRLNVKRLCTLSDHFVCPPTFASARFALRVFIPNGVHRGLLAPGVRLECDC